MTMSAAVFIAAVNARLSFTQYRLLAEFLGCYQYVLPLDRKVNHELVHHLFTRLMTKYPATTACNLISDVSKLLETNVPIHIQSEILNELRNKSKEIANS